MDKIVFEKRKPNQISHRNSKRLIKYIDLLRPFNNQIVSFRELNILLGTRHCGIEDMMVYRRGLVRRVSTWKVKIVLPEDKK